MRAALLRHYGDNRGVDRADVPVPAISDTDLLVEVRAASVNPLDFKTRNGQLRPLLKYRLPMVLGNDLAGVVRQVGSRVRRFAVGDEIYACLHTDRIGAFAEWAAVREADAALRPANTGFEQAASLPLVALAAWQALVEIGHLQAGQRVLVHAGSGGVGTVAIQIARHLGAEVLTTVGRRNAALVERLGATTAIDYRSQRFEAVARACDLVLDVAGGDTLVRSFDCVKPGGLVVSIGSTPSAAFARRWGLNPLLVFAVGLMARKVTAAARARRSRFEYLFVRPDGEALARIARLVEDGVIVPVVDRVFALDEVKEALAYSESGRATGKVVLRIG